MFRLFVILILILGLSSCYVIKWNSSTDDSFSSAPRVVSDFFSENGNRLVYDALSPGYSYKYDIGEKDSLYGKVKSNYNFDVVEIELADSMPTNTVLANIRIMDSLGNQFSFKNVDLLRFVPRLESKNETIYPEYLLEEFNRFGLTFRKEHNEYNFTNKYGEAISTEDNVYRCKLTNNCLDPTKFEFEVTSENYSDFSDRLGAVTNLNQNRIFAHSWFNLDKQLYAVLMKIKNPQLDFDIYMEYDSLSNISEQVVIDFDALRNPIKELVKTKTIEIGHQTNRKIEPLDVEQFYKYDFNLLLKNKDHTYSSILEDKVQTAQFKNEGFYTELTPKTFDFGWMKYADDVKLEIIKNEGTDAYVQITIGGEWSPYNLTIGNVDLALLGEQKLSGLLFGVNTYPKTRRYNPVQSSIKYDADLLPDGLKPFVLLTDSKSGKWVNNQYKGIEKIYLTYESIERDVLNIYVLSYERITPVWMARVKLPNYLREKVRVRKNLYAY